LGAIWEPKSDKKYVQIYKGHPYPNLKFPDVLRCQKAEGIIAERQRPI
jgi:hypothetical protein